MIRINGRGICFATMLSALALAGCAHTPSTRHVANLGQAADSMSTVIALNFGWIEGNPIIAAHPWLLWAKPVAPELIQFVPDQYCRPLHRIWAHAGFGPAAHNVLLLIGAPSPIAWGALVISIPALWDWIRRGADEACV